MQKPALRSTGSLPAVAVFLALVLRSAALAQTPTQTPATDKSTPAAPAVSHTCPVVRTPPSAGDTALARTDYDAALTFFRAAVAKEPASEDARLGLVRALIGKDQTADAIQEAAAMIAASPSSAVAQVAAAEAAYRDADFTGMFSHAQKGLSLNHCEGRVLDVAASFYEITAGFATEARLLETAHALRPTDELILRDWISSLPRSRRAIELDKYLNGPNALSDKDRAGYVNQQDYLRARRPGECHIASRADTTTIPFVPIYGDHGTIGHPEAFGLDVSFDGKKRRMQIDTGASGIVLSPSAAKRLGLTPEYKLHTGGVGDQGDVESYLTHVANIQIGDVTLSNCMVEVLGKSKLGIDGLIGLDVFRRWLATLDYPNEKLILAPLPPLPNANVAQAADADDRPPQDAIQPAALKSYLPIARIGHEILLPTRINGGRVRYMMADTGAGESSLSLPYARESGKVHVNSDVKFTGISGEVKKVYEIDNVRLQFGALGLPATSYFVFDITRVSHNTGAEISGFVGLPTLSRLTITLDYRDNLIDMKYDPKHDVQRF